MSVMDSLFVGIFGMTVVFIVLIGLSLLLRFQSELISRFSKKKTNKSAVAETEDVTPVAASAVAELPFETPPNIHIPVATPAPVLETIAAPTQDSSYRAKPAGNGNDVVTAPVAGTVIEVMTVVGANVKRGDLLILLEAMKMENGIAATRDGTVAKILTSCGKSCIAGTPLVVIQ